jgi:hypothetical protein
VRWIGREPGERSGPALHRPFGAIGCSLARAVAVIAALLWCSSGEAADEIVAANVSHSAKGSIDRFWDDFRTAVRANDPSAIARLTQFPFVVRWGNADDRDPRITYDRSSFQHELGRLLSLETAGEKVTMAQVVDGTSRIGDANVSSGTFMVGSFEFRFIGGSWHWMAAFTTDSSFFPASESSPVPTASPLRKFLLDVTAEAAHLRRPLKVSHLRSTGESAYLEARESGKEGRTVRAFLLRKPDDPKGRMAWEVKQYSFQPSDSDVEWRSLVDGLVQSGVPASLFPARGPDQGGRHGN